MVSNRSNGIYRSVIAALVGLSLLGAGGWIGISQQLTYEQRATQQAANYAKTAAEQIAKPCIGITPPKLRLCLEDEAGEYRLKARDNKRDYDDLAAQQTAALWGKIMGIAALIGMALSAVGVWLVKTTFDETRKANDIAANFQRAIIVAKLKIGDKSENVYVFSVDAENIGASPAVDVKVFVRISDDIPKIAPDQRNFDGQWHVKPGESQFLAAFHSIDSSEDGKFVYGAIRYKTVFGATHYTHFCFRIMRSRIHPYISAPASRIGVDSKPINWPADT